MSFGDGGSKPGTKNEKLETSPLVNVFRALQDIAEDISCTRTAEVYAPACVQD